MPTTMSFGGPEDVLIEAAVPAEWQKEKEAIFAGMDAYAVKALGMALMADVADGRRPCRPTFPPITCPTTVIVGEHDHPLVDQAPDLAAELDDGRLTVIEGAYHSPQLTHPDAWRARWGPTSHGRTSLGVVRDRRGTAAGERPHRAGRLGRHDPASRRRHVGLGRKGAWGMGGYEQSLAERPPGCLGGQHRGRRRPLRHGRGLRGRRERAHRRQPAGRRPGCAGRGHHRHEVHAEPVEAQRALGAALLRPALARSVRGSSPSTSTRSTVRFPCVRTTPWPRPSLRPTPRVS